MILVWVVVMVFVYLSPVVMLAASAAMADKAWRHAADIVGESVSWRDAWRWAWLELLGSLYLAIIATAITIAMATAAGMMILQTYF